MATRGEVVHGSSLLPITSFIGSKPGAPRRRSGCGGKGKLEKERLELPAATWTALLALARGAPAGESRALFLSLDRRGHLGR